MIRGYSWPFVGFTIGVNPIAHLSPRFPDCAILPGTHSPDLVYREMSLPASTSCPLAITTRINAIGMRSRIGKYHPIFALPNYRQDVSFSRVFGEMNPQTQRWSGVNS